MEGKATWLLSLTDHELGGCCLQMKLRDAGRFGQFMLEEGRIDGKSILPDGWMEAATQTQVSIWGPWGYGYQWWTFGEGTYRAIGIHGQLIHIDPARQLVVVISSAWPEAENMQRQMTGFNFLTTLSRVLDAE